MERKLQYQLMEYKIINSLSLLDSPSTENAATLAYNSPNPQLNIQLNNLYYLISKLFQQQQKTQQELHMLREELALVKNSGNSHQNQNLEDHSYSLKKEDDGQPAIKQKKKLPKQFKCQLPFCARKYGSVTALRAHMRTKHVTNDDNLDFVPL